MGTQAGGRRQSPAQSLGRQGSLYNLTLSEVQSHLGEPLHGMNLDDLLRNVLAADGSPLYRAVDVENIAVERPGIVALNGGLSKKTVDEVWRDIQQRKTNDGRSLNHERQMSFGEMTLEDFLTKAGLVAEGSDMSGSDAGNVGFLQGPHRLHQYHQMPQPLRDKGQPVIGAYLAGRQVSQPLGIGSCSMLEAAYPEGHVGISPPLVGAMSDPQALRRKRGVREDVEEKTVERRQKRMIKNRESAARSRARKQAYTNELENKISRLEEENEMLRKQKELDTILHSAPPPEPKHQLRRSNSAAF